MNTALQNRNVAESLFVILMTEALLLSLLNNPLSSIDVSDTYIRKPKGVQNALPLVPYIFLDVVHTL